MGLALTTLEWLAIGSEDRQAGNGDRLASTRISAVLELEESSSTGSTFPIGRSNRPHSQDDDVIHLTYMNAVLVSIDIWQAPAHLDDDHFGPFNHRAVPDIGGTEVEVTVLVQRAYLKNDHVHWLKEPAVVVGTSPRLSGI